MPKPNPLSNDIHALYARQTVHVLIYGFIQGAQWVLPSISRKEAAQAFLQRFKVFIDGYEAKDILDIYDAVNRDIIERPYARKAAQ